MGGRMKKGFTVIELVLVIMALVIIIGIAIPRSKGTQQYGWVTKAKGELQTLQSAMESYYNFAATPHVFINTTPVPCASYFISTSPQIVFSALYDPFASSNTEYTAVVSSSGIYYAFGSIGTGTSVVLTVPPSGNVTHASGNLCISNGSGCL